MFVSLRKELLVYLIWIILLMFPYLFCNCTMYIECLLLHKSCFIATKRKKFNHKFIEIPNKHTDLTKILSQNKELSFTFKEKQSFLEKENPLNMESNIYYCKQVTYFINIAVHKKIQNIRQSTLLPH